MNKAPDTRNRLDSNVGIKKKRKEEKYSMSEFKQVASVIKLGVTPTGRKPKKLTPSQQFRVEHGFSKTMAKLMKRNGVETVEGYRLLRRERKKAEKLALKTSRKSEPVKATETKNKGKKK